MFSVLHALKKNKFLGFLGSVRRGRGKEREERGGERKKKGFSLPIQTFAHDWDQKSLSLLLLSLLLLLCLLFFNFQKEEGRREERRKDLLLPRNNSSSNLPLPSSLTGLALVDVGLGLHHVITIIINSRNFDNNFSGLFGRVVEVIAGG